MAIPYLLLENPLQRRYTLTNKKQKFHQAIMAIVKFSVVV